MLKTSKVWRGWDSKSFEKAKKEGRALLVYIRHAGCYWCERMERESFVDEEIAGLIERDFIAIKVDSHVRPDVGRHCHALFTQMTGREANYPLVLFFSPALIPLYTATYMPDRDRDGMMGLRETIELVARKYETQRALLLDKGREVQAAMSAPRPNIQATKLNRSVLGLALEQIKTLHDNRDGGFGRAPKFPRYSVLQLGMDIYIQNPNTELKKILCGTLDTMIHGGLRDSKDGGFFRYCRDAAWTQPAEGKMLYDNALAAEVLLRASRLFGEKSYRTAALQTVEFIQSQMRKGGLFGAFFDEGRLKDARIIFSWGAMAIKSLFLAGEYDSIYRQLAIESLEKLLEHGVQNGQLYHSFMPGELPVNEAFLEDYAYLSEVLMVAYEQTKEKHYLAKASEFINEALKRFFNDGFWLFDKDEFMMLDSPEDSMYPSGTAIMAGVLQKAAKIIDISYEKFALRTLEVNSYILMREPISMPQLSRVLLDSIEHSSQIESLGRC